MVTPAIPAAWLPPMPPDVAEPAAPAPRKRTAPDARPEIIITPRIDQLAETGARALALAGGMYQRAAELVHVVGAERPVLRGSATVVVAGEPVIRPVGRGHLRAELVRAARWVAPTEDGGRRETPPPDAVVRAIMERGDWSDVPHIVGVITTPTIRPDGTVLDVAGYDPATALHVALDREYPAVPAAPTRDDARAALARLVAPLEHFPVAAEADRYVPIAALLTAIARSMVDGAVPLVALDASVIGSGKSLLATLLAVLVRGRPEVGVWPTGEGELAKVLGAHVLAGARLVILDDAGDGTVIGAPELDALATARGSVTWRVLGQSVTRTLPWLGLVMITGNNLAYRGGTIDRVLACRLAPADERPRDRQGLPPLLDDARRDRVRLVCDALTLARAWHLAGRPRMECRTWGSYESWSQTIPPMIAWAGGPDVLACRASVRDGATVDPDRAALTAMLGGLARLLPPTWRARDITDALWPGGRPRRDLAPDGWDDLRDAVSALCRARGDLPPTPRQIGDVLRRYRDRWVDDRHLEQVGVTHGSARWQISTRHAPGGSDGSEVVRSTPFAGEDVGVGREGTRPPATRLTPPRESRGSDALTPHLDAPEVEVTR
jgi:hypothetical protein